MCGHCQLADWDVADAGVCGSDDYIVPHHLPADQMHLLVQHLASTLGTVVLLITTIPLPIKAFPTINSAKDIFTLVYNRTGCASYGCRCTRPHERCQGTA